MSACLAVHAERRGCDGKVRLPCRGRLNGFDIIEYGKHRLVWPGSIRSFLFQLSNSFTISKIILFKPTTTFQCNMLLHGRGEERIVRRLPDDFICKSLISSSVQPLTNWRRLDDSMKLWKGGKSKQSDTRTDVASSPHWLSRKYDGKNPFFPNSTISSHIFRISDVWIMWRNIFRTIFSFPSVRYSDILNRISRIGPVRCMWREFSIKSHTPSLVTIIQNADDFIEYGNYSPFCSIVSCRRLIWWLSRGLQ